MPLCSPQISYGLIWVWTPGFAVPGRPADCNWITNRHILNMAPQVEGRLRLSSVELAQLCMWKAPDCCYTSHHIQYGVCLCIYRVSQEECARLRESVPYVKLYRYNPKHLCPKLNGYRDNGQRKVRSSCGSTYYTCSANALRVHCACPWDWNAFNIVPACPCKVLGTLRTTTALMRVFM